MSKIVSLKMVYLSFTASVLGVTQLLGSFITPPIMERFGRRIAHLAVTMPVLIGWFITMMATTYEVSTNFSNCSSTTNVVT